MEKIIVLFLIVGVCFVQCQPFISIEADDPLVARHRIAKRFINPSLTYGDFKSSLLGKIRAKRSDEEECEKLKLCTLHARSSSNFISAFELYFVNKENAHLWDHQAHSVADCHRRFSCYR